MEEIVEITVFLNTIEFNSKSGSLVYFYLNEDTATNIFNLITTPPQIEIDHTINEDGEEILLF